jgi:hypothetical protein
VNRLHALQHLHELQERVAFLRALRPESPTYKLWIGDIAEFANTVWGMGSVQSLRLAAALKRPAVGPSTEDAATRNYLERLEQINAVLAEYQQELNGRDGSAN